ncbi:MAG: hypothetical protein HY769_04310 [Candidatus Stahlbacteria bacterium]|nr:hypothetical protein [Candidatus Stahlbacteria bacterium]
MEIRKGMIKVKNQIQCYGGTGQRTEDRKQKTENRRQRTEKKIRKPRSQIKVQEKDRFFVPINRDSE